MGIKERQDREKQAVRQSILDVARDLFVTEGYRNVSMRKIAERIEYSPAAIYSYFPSKDDIYMALAEDGFRLLDARLKSALHASTPLDHVRAGWWAFYEFSKEQPAYFELMFVDRSVPKITEGWEGFEILQSLMADATAWLQRAKDAGQLPASMDPAAAMHVLWGALMGPSVLALCHRLSPGEGRDRLASDVLEAVIAGLQAGSPTTFHAHDCPVESPVVVRSESPMKRSVVVLALVLVAGTLAACQSSQATAQTPAEPVVTTVDVPVVTANVGRIEAALEISGTLAPRSRVPVKPRVPGALERVLVDIGDAVSEGQTIATIDRREIDAQADAATAAVAVAKAALETSEATLANAVLEADRARVLFDGGALPRQRLDAAQTAHRAAVAQRDLATANLAQAEASLRRAREVQRNTTVSSPVTGYIVERNYDAGSIPGDLPVVVVADLRQMKLEAGVSELEAGRLRVGMKARIEAQAKPGRTFEGELAAIAPEVDERNRHFRIEVRVPNVQRDLLSGMYATARIVESTVVDALVVPREAVGSREGKRVVLKVQDGSVSPVEVREGLSDGGRVQILSGLAPGDTVIADARRQVAAGTRVRAVPAR